MHIVIKMDKKKQNAIREILDIPTEVEVSLNSSLVIKGPKGELKRKFITPNVKLSIEDKKIIISSLNDKKAEKKLLYTVKSHIKNMIKGVIEGYVYKLQVCSLHFPMTVTIDKEKGFVIIKNFIGESKERKSKILPGVNVSLKGDIITVEGYDKESTGQTAANIETATKIRAKDRRIFQDGIYLTEKAGDLIGD